jgi:hypothetical protein
MQSKIEFCSNCAVNMLQNISARRVDKRITLGDLAIINNSCHMSFLPFDESSNRVWNNMTLLSVCGTGNNRCKVMWSMYNELTGRNVLCSGSYSYRLSGPLTASGLSIFYGRQERMQNECDSTALYPGFFIKAGEKKVILETGYGGKWGQPKFGFWLLKLRPGPDNKNVEWKKYINIVTIFTPKSGLFSETVPSS